MRGVSGNNPNVNLAHKLRNVVETETRIRSRAENVDKRVLFTEVDFRMDKTFLNQSSFGTTSL